MTISLNKSHKAQCYINKPYKPARSWLNLISRYSDPPEDLNNPIHVDLAPFPTHIREDGSVAFGNSRDGRKEAIRMKDRVVKPEVLIMATGYRQSWDWLGEGYAKGPQDVDTLEMLDSKDISTCWIGHVRPGVVGHSICESERHVLMSSFAGRDSANSGRTGYVMGATVTRKGACPEGSWSLPASCR